MELVARRSSLGRVRRCTGTSMMPSL